MKFGLSACLIASMFLLMISCKKSGNLNPVDPANQQEGFQFIVEDLPGTSIPGDNLYFLFSIANDQGNPVIEDQQLTVKYDEKYFSSIIDVLPGRYRITKFLIFDAETKQAKYAIPLSGSGKASLVTRPLSISFMVNGKITINTLNTLPIQNGDTENDFGYAVGEFNRNQQQDPDQDSDIKIKLQQLIRIGDIVYDSVPVHLKLTTWKKDGTQDVKNLHLPAGINEIMLPQNGVQYKLSISKWGIQDELTLSKDDVEEGTVYSLGGQKSAKKLKYYDIAIENGKGGFKTESRSHYIYDGEGNSKEKIVLRKNEDNTNYLAQTTNYTNLNGKITLVSDYDGNKDLISKTSFTYDPQGKFQQIREEKSGVITTGAVSYYGLSGSTGISADYGVEVLYSYSNIGFTTKLIQSYTGGSKTNENSITSHHDSELANYEYDFEINPFIHMKLPDLYLSQYSKHNPTVKYLQFGGAILKPAAAPYRYDYVYDADGYPLNVITYYFNYRLGVHAYTTKTVYTYY